MLHKKKALKKIQKSLKKAEIIGKQQKSNKILVSQMEGRSKDAYRAAKSSSKKMQANTISLGTQLDQFHSYSRLIFKFVAKLPAWHRQNPFKAKDFREKGTLQCASIFCPSAINDM